MRLSEVYQSVQGEGPQVGVPTVFVRTAGCNLRCPKWPCDTQYAIDPEKYRNDWRQAYWGGLVEEITKYMTDNICFTGGEPMLHYRTGLSETIARLAQAGYHLEMFSNGTRPYPPRVINSVDVVMDWKLPGSGEHTVLTDVRWENYRKMVKASTVGGRNHVAKFTIADREDYEFARDIFERMCSQKIGTLPIYYGVVWGKLTNEELISWALRDGLDWKFNIQIHKHIWPNIVKGV